MSFAELIITNYSSAAAFVCILLFVGWHTHNRYGRGLIHIPGPFLASLSSIWRLLVVWKGRVEVTHIKLHQKLGPLVRLGPNVVSCSSASAIPIIYALNAGFVKSDFYKVQQTLSKGQPLFTLFTSTDERFHSRLRRAVSNAYAMSSLVQFEPFVDSTTQAFFDQVDTRFAANGKVCNFGAWLQYYAFDVIGELTYSKRLGFVDQGCDVEGIITSIEGMLDYAAVVGQMSWLDQFLLKNPIRRLLGRYGFISANTPMVVFARKRLSERIDPTTGEKIDTSEPHAGKRDFLSRFLEANEKDPDFITDQRVLALTVANIFAGSDTTAISLRAIFYYLLKHPQDLDSLVDELNDHQRNSPHSRSDGMINWSDARELPFLDAVIKEGLRLHPAVGLPLERIVPRSGISVCGRFIPGGTIIGCSAWVIHRDADVFGPNPEEFRPQRWLTASKEHRRTMESSLFSFGAGARTCIGKNISLLEMYKLVPAMLLRYRIELAEPAKDWKLHNAWFVRQREFYVKFTKREIA